MAVAPPDNPYDLPDLGGPAYAPSMGGVGPAAGVQTTNSPYGPTVVTQSSPGGFTQPDWSGLLAQWLTPYEQMNSANLAALKAQIDAQSRLASQRFQGSDTSTLARLSDTHDTNVRNIIHSLAGRGLINSGDKGFQNRREDLRYKRDTTDASNALLDYLTGLQGQYADAQRQGLFGLQNQRLSLASTLGQMYQPTYSDPTYQTSVPGVAAPKPAVSWQVPGGTVEAY